MAANFSIPGVLTIEPSSSMSELKLLKDMSITPEEMQIVLLMSTIANSLSILGSVFNIATSLYLRNSHQAVEKMVLGISLMDIIYNAFSLLFSIKD